jgi:M6 family metalloprotease-like protein
MKTSRIFIQTLIAVSSCLLLLLPATQLQAVIAEPAAIRKVQPDGTAITIVQRGDERVHWMETLDGYTLLYDAERYIVYATTNAAGNLVPSKTRYRGERSSGTQSAPTIDGGAPLQKGLRYSAAQTAAMRARWDAPAAGSADIHRSSVVTVTPVLGEKKALCVLMQYPDAPMEKTAQDFDNLLNQEGYSVDNAKGSVRDFYIENSYGKMELNTTVAGPYTAAHNHDEYGDRSGTKYGGADLAKEAITAAYNAGINLREFANEDGRLETFHVIFAGHGSEASGEPTDIWAHKWQLDAPLTLGEGENKVTAHVYSCSPELRKAKGEDITHIGVICHELCHVFGAPDYYDTDAASGGQFSGTGEWDLMAEGIWNGPTEATWGTEPAHINMFQKIQYGWVTPVELTGSQAVVDMPHAAGSPTAYVINVNDDGEQYILENRQQTGFDSSIPGHGLLIYHVHPSLWSWEKAGNTVNVRHPQQLYPVCANASVAKPNTAANSYGTVNSEGCPFTGKNSKTYFTDASIPMSFSWTTGEGIQSPITGITETNGSISFGYKEKSIPDYTFALNHGDDRTTSKQTAQLAFSITGNDAPTAYKVCEEDASRMNYALWNPYLPTNTYTFASADAGYKTVYVKLRNEVGETEVKNAVIYFKPIEKSNAATPSQTQEGSVKVYPTAVETNLTVEREPDAAPAILAVYSSAGAHCMNKKLTAPVETLDLSQCPAGILLLHVSDGKTQVTLPLLKL